MVNLKALLKAFSKITVQFAVKGLSILLIVCCVSPASVHKDSMPPDGGATDISAQGALGRIEAAPVGPLFSGDGRKDIGLAVLAPETQGNVPAYLPLYIQGLLNNNIKKYSAINLIDRQNLDRIISEQDIAANGRFSDQDFISIGNLVNARYCLFGTLQRLSGERYALHLSITESATGIRMASFFMDGSLAQLEGNGTLINEATADLLSQMGVELTATGTRTLLAGNSSVVRAEAGVARGIMALAGGDEVGALFNITQAITFDPSNLEALSRLDTLSLRISGGTVSQRIVSDIQARNRWLDVAKETARFFNDHPPFEITFDPNLVQIGQTDYVKETANIGMRVALDPLVAGFSALNTLLEGLEKTGKRTIWGFEEWPLLDIIPIAPETKGTAVFDSSSSFKYKIDVSLKNENNKNLGNSSITLTTETIRFSNGKKRVQAPAGTMGTLQFSNVRADDLTPALTIVIVAVNGIPSHDLYSSGYMKIDTGDLEKRHQEWSRREEARLAEVQKQETARLAQAQKEKAERRENFWTVFGGISAIAVMMGVVFLAFYLSPADNTMP
jgi:hypothetical protein